MSTSYTLVLTAEAGSREQVVHALHQGAAASGALAASAAPPPAPDQSLVLSSGLQVHVRPAPTSARADSAATDFGITATLLAALWIDDSRPVEPQVAQMVTVVLALLDRVPGDALLHLDYEDAWLLRRAGQLLVNDDPEVWTPERSALVTRPHQRVRLAFAGDDEAP
jgi:hypothetical protein